MFTCFEENREDEEKKKENRTPDFIDRLNLFQ